MSEQVKDIRLALTNYVKDWEDDEIKKCVHNLLEKLEEDLLDNGYEPDSSVVKAHKKLVSQIELLEEEEAEEESKSLVANDDDDEGIAKEDEETEEDEDDS